MAGTAYSLGSHHFSHIRCARSRGRKGTPCEGKVFGGIYYPKHMRQDNRIVPARWEGSFFINNMYYTDPNSGERREGRKDIIRICAWNGNNAQPGRGLADLFAKSMSPGKELSGEFDMRTYDRKVYLSNGQMVTEPDGTPVTIPGMIKFYVERGKFVLGADSSKFIQAEIQDGLRPPDWTNAASPNYQRWQQANADRNAEVWQGLPFYGYAQVFIENNVRYEYQLRNEPMPNLRIFNAMDDNQNQSGFGNPSNNSFNGPAGSGGGFADQGNTFHNNPNGNAGGFGGNQNNNGFNAGGNQNNAFQNNFGGGNANGNNWNNGGGNGFNGNQNTFNAGGNQNSGFNY